MEFSFLLQAKVMPQNGDTSLRALSVLRTAGMKRDLKPEKDVA
jgi:hypothetical protein